MSEQAGDPVGLVSHLVPGTRVDELLRHAARERPTAIGLRSWDGDVDYATLDSAADRLAGAVQELAGGVGQVVAVTLELDPAFPPAFFGVLRAGCTPALVNPLLQGEGLAHVLNASGARVLIAAPELLRRLAEVRDRVPQLHTVLLTHRDARSGAEAEGVPTVADLLAQPARPVVADPQADGDRRLACIQFTSGSTGPAKGVRLSHRNLLVNAAQVAYTHGVDADSVVFNYLPSYHLMHLTMSLAATATHVLCRETDPADAVRVAAQAGATHFYSLPMRFAQLAASPRLRETEVPTLRAMMCGGSALPAPVVTALTSQFQVPVVQGYGLQETSPLTHFNDVAGPRLGSSGTPVPGTVSRIVDPATGDVLPPNARGELQVRGPQVMIGYLGQPDTGHLQPDGWFATGDIGYTDAQGHLYVVDRIKDVFKRDNWLVSPTEIERVLRRHPAVLDCVVLDYPHPVSGAVAYAMVIGTTEADPAELAGFVNRQLPYYEHLEHVELVTDIARTPTGKPARAQLREELRRRYLASTEN